MYFNNLLITVGLVCLLLQGAISKPAEGKGSILLCLSESFINISTHIFPALSSVDQSGSLLLDPSLPNRVLEKRQSGGYYYFPAAPVAPAAPAPPPPPAPPSHHHHHQDHHHNNHHNHGHHEHGSSENHS